MVAQNKGFYKYNYLDGNFICTVGMNFFAAVRPRIFTDLEGSSGLRRAHSTRAVPVKAINNKFSNFSFLSVIKMRQAAVCVCVYYILCVE